MQADWLIDAPERVAPVSQYSVGLRYTIQKYKAQTGSETANANCFGLNFGVLF